MSDIKSVMGLLSKIINNFFNVNFKAEHFRLAKYDNEDENIVPLFWNLLNKCCDQNNNKNIILNVKLYFASLGYRSIEFYSLPDDTGSQELLLAFSWLLQKEKLFENVLKKELANSEINKEFQINSHTSKKTKEIPELSSTEEFYNYILWISGQINNNFKQIAEYKTKTLQLSHKVHKETRYTKNVSHLSTNETNLLKHQDMLKNYLDRIHSVTQMLDYYKRWKSKESYYWEWMLTVIKEKEKKNVTIKTEILQIFFLELRNHVKKILTKSISISAELKDLETHQPRSIYAPKSENNLTQNKSNLTKVQEKHEKHFTDITEFLKLYCIQRPN